MTEPYPLGRIACVPETGFRLRRAVPAMRSVREVSPARHRIERMYEEEISQRAQRRGDGYLPPGWPQQVSFPGSEEWPRTAAAYLLDCCPADFRGYQLLRRHPVVLARFASHVVDGQIAAARHGVADVRTSLNRHVDPPVLEAAVEIWLEQAARLALTRRAVGLLEEAVRGQVFRRPL
jgi:hypothetical protein